MNRWKYGVAALGFAGTALVSPAAYAAEYIDIDLNGSFHFQGGDVITNIAVANPAIADVVRPSGFDSEVLIVGVAPGSTNLFVWYANGAVEDYVVTVGIDDIGQARAIQRMIGLPRVRVQVVPVGDGTGRRVLLRGTVKNQAEHDMALKVASLYTGDIMEKDRADTGTSSTARGISNGSDFEYDFDYRSGRIYSNVVDLLTIENPSQIRLEAQLIEISSDDAENIGFKYGGVNAQGSINSSYQRGDGESARTWVGSYLASTNVSLNYLIQNGKAKVLSRPSVSTMSGAKAKIFIGGQFPVPVNNGNGSESIEWKDYGIRLHIRPTVGADGMITAEVHAGVSRLDYSNTVVTSATTVPAVTAREAHSIMHLDSGSTMVVGGLLNSEDVKTVSKVPLLGDIPIIGEFFKHTESSTERRELIILITPVIVDENTPARMSEKMQDYYGTGREEEKARKDVDLNADRDAEKAKTEEERARKEREEVEAAWRARENSVPRVKPGNAWARPNAPESEAAVEAAQAPNPADANRSAGKTAAEIEEENRAREAREAAVNEWRDREESAPRVRPGNAWARVEYPPDDAAAAAEAGNGASGAQ